MGNKPSGSQLETDQPYSKPNVKDDIGEVKLHLQLDHQLALAKADRLVHGYSPLNFAIL